jgi:hypothetical protein
MYMVRFKHPNISQVAYKVFKTIEDANKYAQTVDLIEIKEIDHE